ncbi:MAG: hypothetical protein J5988_00540 [Eubacterium sp.]|nr:hypothetical protein [Eubacterium sp.]
MKKKVYYDGYMTVEATFIVPAAIMILVLLLYWGFFCYDKSVSIQCSYLAALRTSNEWGLTITEAEQLAMEELDEMTEERFLFVKRGEIAIDAGLLSIEAGVNGKMDILFSTLRGDDMNHWLMNSRKSAYRLKPSSYIRKYRLAGEALE